MKFGLIFRIIGILLMVFSLTMLGPLAISFLYQDGGMRPFILSFTITSLAGLALWLLNRNREGELHAREGFIIVALFWIVLGGVSSLPLHFSKAPDLSTTDAVFEAVSGLTTTGATIIDNIESLPQSMLWYRQQMQWLGGLGVVVIALAILPLLGVGGMQLYRAETTGPSKHDKMKPRLRETARSFLKIYLLLTIACGLAYWLAGMSGFDAVAHAMSTISTGGFSTYDASIAHFDSRLVEFIAIVFMTIGGLSFGLLYLMIVGRKPLALFEHSEARGYLATIGAIVLLTTVYLLYTAHHPGIINALFDSLFQVVSVITSTGFSTERFASWPGFLPVLLIFLSIMGGCAGSTSGGMKVIRFQLLLKQGKREVQKLVHPNAVMPVKIGKRLVNDRIIESIWGFFAAYTVVYVVLMVMLIASGLDQVSAFSAVAATLNNLGPGLGDVADNFAGLTDFGKWVGILAMLMGRLEIFTVLVLLTPEFWRH
ncbi:MAG: TrkH family potassium uptake protein [Gammaproteobacteria bacterium]|nr:TrkH family potassium uptake protein [Gammaproteobacteria bacterium]